jgi:hypothetical protein
VKGSIRGLNIKKEENGKITIEHLRQKPTDKEGRSEPLNRIFRKMEQNLHWWTVIGKNKGYSCKKACVDGFLD